jgi:DASH complex subunit ASK1
MAIPRDDEQSFSAAHDAGSFVFGHGATASTPLAKKQYTGIGNDSWESSIESPFEKNDRRLRDMQIEGNAGHDFDDSSDLPTPSLPGGYSLDESTSSSPSIRPQSNPAGQSRPMSSTPKAARNPTASSFHPIGLRSTPLNAKFPKLKSKPSSNVNVHVNANSSSGPRSQAPLDFDDDSDDDDLPGMSPLRTTTFAHFPPRVQAINNAIRDKTPKKSVPAGAIVDSIMSEMGASASEFEGTYQPSPTGTPDFAKGYNKDFVSRYSLLPQEMGPKPVENLLAKLKASEAAPRNTRKSMANTSFGSDKVSGPGPGQGQGQLDDEEDSYDQDDSDDSDDSGTVPPPVESDVSYTTNDPGMTNRYDMTTTLHPGQQPERDSEVFGAPDRAPSAERAQLHIMRQEEMYTYMGGSLEDAAGREVEETPLRGVSRKTVKGQLDGRRAL